MVQRDKLTENYKQFARALNTIKEAIVLEKEASNSENDKLSRALKDSVIQRFEYTYEILWKMLKNISEFENMESKSPRETFKNAFQLGFIKQEEERVFLEMIRNRNLTSHTYNEQVSLGIFNFISIDGLNAFDIIEQRLNDYIKKLN